MAKSTPVVLDLVGFKELARDLPRLGPKAARSVMRQSLRAGAKIVLNAAQAKAPARTGKLRASLKMTMKSNRRRGTFGYTVATGDKMFAGATFYGGFVEYGTYRMSERSFLRRAFDDNQQRMLDAMRTKLGSAIEKALRKAGTERAPSATPF